MSVIISDQSNFIIVDPNSKEITENGVSKIVPKAIEQEDLVIFCNLKSYPKERSYILQGSDKGENKIVSVASGQFNLLKPNQEKDKFTTDWTDINLQNGQLNGEEALGITSIDVTYDTSYVPRVTINMVDVRSQALNSYEEGSPYKTFFSFPYPLFILEMKGYYGKLVKYILHLKKYNSRYNNSTGNFEITCEFVGFTFAVLSDLNIYLGLVASQMKLPIGNGSDILDEIYLTQIKKETDPNKKKEIESIFQNCKTFYELIRKSKNIQDFFSNFGLQSSNIFDIKISLDEYLKSLQDFLILIPKNDTNTITLNSYKKGFNQLTAVKTYPELGLNTTDATDKTIGDDKKRFVVDLEKLKNIAVEKYKINDDEIDGNLRSSVINYLGFTPTIENVFRIICNNFQVFLTLLGKTSINAAKKETRKKIYLSERNKSNQFTQELEGVFPWPYIWNESGNVQFPGQTNNLTGGLTINDYPEIDFVNEYIRAQTEVNELLEVSAGTNIEITNIDFNPIHSVQYTKQKPFNSDKIIDILYEILEHSLLASQYQDQSIVGNIAKSDAQNLIENLGLVNKNYVTLYQSKNIGDFINQINELNGNIGFKSSIDRLKNNFKIINSGDTTTNPRVVKVNDDLIAIGDTTKEGYLYTFDKSTISLGNDRSYYKDIKIFTPSYKIFKYDNLSGNNQINYGYPTITYDKTINPNSIYLGFLQNIIKGSKGLFYYSSDTLNSSVKVRLKSPTNLSELGNFTTNTKIHIGVEAKLDIKYINSQLKNLGALKSSFELFIAEILRKSQPPYSFNFYYNYTVLTMPYELHSLFKQFYTTNSLFFTKLYTVLPTLVTKYFTLYDEDAPADPFGLGLSLPDSNRILINSSLLKYTKSNGDISNDNGFNYNNFLLNTWAPFLSNITNLIQNYYTQEIQLIGEESELYDKETNELKFNVSIEKKDIQSAQSLYKYITDWLNSDVVVNNSNYGLEKIYNDPYNVVYPKKNEGYKIDSGELKYNFYANQYIYNFMRELESKLDTSLNEKEANAKVQALITDENVKLSLYLHFKNINDKWIYVDSDSDKATYAFNLTGDIYNNKDKDLIDYFYFVDRGNRYIGNELFLDIGVLGNYLQKNNGNNSLYSLIGEILSKNDMNFHALTSYISYLDNNKVEDIFNTQLNTIQADSQPAFICQYIGKPVTYPYENQNHFPDYLKFNFDTNTFNSPVGGELFNSSDPKNVLNKAVCFTVDVGIQNQNVFKNIQLDQSEFRETQESLIVVDKLTSRDSNKFTETIGNNLFNVYSRRSYTCKVETFGNLMIQPTMYFYLRYIPLFNGLYLITKVSHNLQGNVITTNFEGVKVPIFTFPIPKNFIATLSKNVYSNYKTNVLPNYTPNPKYYDELPVDVKNNINTIYRISKDKGITNPITIAAILAVVSKESSFRPIREGTYYSSNDTLKKSPLSSNDNYKQLSALGDDYITWVRTQKDFKSGQYVLLMNQMYYGQNGNESKIKSSVEYKNKTFDNSPDGDGYKYRGGGFNQLTGRENYRVYGLEDVPSKIESVETAVNVLIQFNINNVGLLKDKAKFGITGKKGLEALNSFTELNNAYDAMFNVTAGPGFTLNTAIKYYGVSYKKGFVNLQSLFDAIQSGKIK
jgi:predicted chitinase